MDRRFLLPIFTLAGIAMLGIWAKRSWPTLRPPSNDIVQLDAAGQADLPDSESTSQDDVTDDDCQRLLGAPGASEALTWLTTPGNHHAVPKWETAEVVDVVQKFYAAGALKIIAVNLSKSGQSEATGQFIVVLPSDPAIRKQVFACEAAFQADDSEGPPADIGQKYLSITMD